MSLNTQEIFDTVASKYGATAEHEKFVQWFFLALTRIGNDLASSKVGISITIPTDLETDIDCDDHYFGTFLDGLNLYIQESGMWGSDESNTLEVRYERDLRKAHTHYMGTQTVYTGINGA